MKNKYLKIIIGITLSLLLIPIIQAKNATTVDPNDFTIGVETGKIIDYNE